MYMQVRPLKYSVVVCGCCHYITTTSCGGVNGEVAERRGGKDLVSVYLISFECRWDTPSCAVPFCPFLASL